MSYDAKGVDEAISFWRDFCLPDKMGALEQTCTEMRESKSASIKGRKRLNEVTKAFRSRTTDEQILTFTEVLRAYQDEIDQLARRSKLSESSLYYLYKDLFGAPDPYQILQHMSTRANQNTNPSDITSHSDNADQVELSRLKKEIAQYEEEFSVLRNQDVTIRRLEEQLQEMRTYSDERAAKEGNLQASDKLAALTEEKQAVERRLADAVDAMHDAHSQCTNLQQQLLSAQSHSDARVEALTVERGLLIDSVERYANRVAELTQQVGMLNTTIKDKDEKYADSQKLQQSDHNLIAKISSSGKINTSDADDEIAADIQLLRQELQDSSSALVREKGRFQAAQHQVELMKATLVSVQAELAERPTKEDLQNARRQTRLFQRIAFNENSDSGSDANEDVDPLLLAKVKSLESQLFHARVTNEKLLADKTNATEHATSAENRAIESAALAARLECQFAGEKSPVTRTDIETYTNTKKANEDNDQGLSDLLGIRENKVQPGNVSNSPGSQANARHDTENSSGNMAAILQGQRDRYKGRLDVAEKALTQAQQRLTLEQAACQRLREDNSMLYGRTRYLQTQLGSGQWAQSPGGTVKDIEAGNDVERRYASAYEEQLNPFQEFHETERKRHVTALSVADRIIYSSISTFISTQAGRTGMLAYLGSMHILIFISLFVLVNNVDHGCDLAIDHIAHMA